MFIRECRECPRANAWRREVGRERKLQREDSSQIGSCQQPQPSPGGALGGDDPDISTLVLISQWLWAVQERLLQGSHPWKGWQFKVTCRQLLSSWCWKSFIRRGIWVAPPGSTAQCIPYLLVNLIPYLLIPYLLGAVSVGLSCHWQLKNIIRKHFRYMWRAALGGRELPITKDAQ